MTTLSCTVDLTLDLTAPATARSLADVLLRHWGVRDPDGLDALAIVVSELVTGALTGVGDDGGTAVLSLSLAGGVARVSVQERAVSVPRMRTADDVRLRGTPVLEQLSSRWGAEEDPAGTRLYAEVPLETADRSQTA